MKIIIISLLNYVCELLFLLLYITSSVKTFQAKDKNDYILFLISYLLGPIFTIYGYLKIKGYQEMQ